MKRALWVALALATSLAYGSHLSLRSVELSAAKAGVVIPDEVIMSMATSAPGARFYSYFNPVNSIAADRR